MKRKSLGRGHPDVGKRCRLSKEGRGYSREWNHDRLGTIFSEDGEGRCWYIHWDGYKPGIVSVLWKGFVEIMETTNPTKDRLRALEAEIKARELLRAEREKHLRAITQEIAHLEKETDLLDKTGMTLQAVSAKVLAQSTQTIDKLVTAGLRAVFYDQKLEFKTTVDRSRGKTSIKFELFEDGRTAPLQESYGGGVLCVIAVLLRVTTIVVLGHRRMLLLDESLAHLSEQYHHTASALLKKLCNDLNFVILIITHADNLANSADRHYVAKRTKAGTTFELQGKGRTNQAVTP